MLSTTASSASRFVPYGNERLAASRRARAAAAEPVGGLARGYHVSGVLPDADGQRIAKHARLVCTGPVTYMGDAALEADSRT